MRRLSLFALFLFVITTPVFALDLSGGGGGGGGVTGSGTADFLPKWLTSTSLGDSSLKENAGDITSTKAILIPDGVCATAPSLAFASSPTAGLCNTGVNTLSIAMGGEEKLKISNPGGGVDISAIGNNFIQFTVVGNEGMNFKQGTNIRWQMLASSGDLVPVGNGTINLGASTTPWRQIWAGGSFGAVMNRTKAGVPTDADLAVAGDGALILNTSSTLPYMRSGAVWYAIPNSTSKLDFFAATTSAELSSTLTNETGSGLSVFNVSPLLVGEPIIGDGAGNDSLNFAEEASDGTCAAGDYWIAANSTTSTLRKCQNGSVADLDTGGAGGDSVSVNGVAATDADFDDATPGAPADGVNVRWQKDALSPNNVSANVPVSPNGATSVVGTTRTLTGGAGIAALGDLSADRTVATDSTETSFLSASAITCGAGTAGKMSVTVGSLNWCDNTATPVLRVAPLNTTATASQWFTAFDSTAGTFTKAQPAFSDISGTATSGQLPADVVYSARTLTGGAGIGAIGDLSADRTVATASGEADFLASGALTCGASTQGKMQVHTTPLQYCDNAATPTLRYSAYGDSAGAGLTGDSATAYFAAGQIEAARGGTGDDTSGTTGVPRISAGNWTYDAGISHLTASTSADLATVLSDETGTSGGFMRAGSPTNVTLSVEDTGNAITTVSKIVIDAASCISATAALNWDSPGDGATVPTAACNDTGAIQRPSADFAGGAVNTFERTVKLPSDWTGNIDLVIRYVSVAASPTGNVEWDVSTLCRAVGESWDGTFNTAQTITDAVSSQNFLNDGTQTSLTTTNCAAGEDLTLRISRDGTNDTNNDLAKMLHAELTIRRAQ